MYSFIRRRNEKMNSDLLVPMESSTVSLFSQPFLDTINKCYKNIVVVNAVPKGPLSKIVRTVKFPPLSEFKYNNLKQCECGYALYNYNNDLMIVDEIPDLISYLVCNNYSVDTSITKMFNTSDIRFNTNIGNKLICFITYNGNK
jgi:hypothetical protein